MMQKIEINFQGSPMEAEKFKKAAQKLAEAPADDRNRIYEIISSAKALAALKQYWSMLKIKFS